MLIFVKEFTVLVHLLILTESVSSTTVPPTVTFSLARSVFLPADALINPFYDPGLVEMQTAVNGRSLSINNQSDIDNLFKQESDQQLVSQTGIDYPWQQFISAGPIAINILGQLIIVSSKVDFSFRESAQDYSFRYIRHPQSFRATLIQIANDGYDAFSQAHSSMNQIQLYMGLIPQYIRTSLRILLVASPRLLERLLVPTLGNIERIGRECSKLASDTHDQFSTVMKLLGEVIEVTTLTQGVHMQNLSNIEVELNISRVMEKQQQQIIETVQKHYSEAQASVRDAQASYTQALRSLPTGWKKVLQNLVSGLVDIARAVIPALITGPAGAIAGAVSTGINAATQIVNGVQVVASGISMATKIAQSQALSAANMLFGQLNSMSSKIQELGSTDMQSVKEDLDAGRIVFNTAKQMIKGNDDIPRRVSRLLEQAVNLTNTSNVESYKERLDDLMNQVKPLVAANAANTGQMPSPDISPPSQQASTQTGGKVDNEQFKVTMALERLKFAEQRYDQIFNQLLTQQNEMKAIMVKIASLDLTRIKFKELIELMREAILLLGKIRQQWGGLVQFFSEISIRTRIATNETLVPFVHRMREVSSIQDITESERSLYIDLLKEQAVDIHRHSHILYVMSRTYLDISTEFMMARLSGLATMLTMQTDQERQDALQKLELDTKVVQNRVEALASERKRTFEATLTRRKNELESYLNQIGGLSQNDITAIEEGNQLMQIR